MIRLPWFPRVVPAGVVSAEAVAVPSRDPGPGEAALTGPLKATWLRVPRLLRQICVVVVGAGLLVAGTAMIVLPGPAVLVLPLGLAVLATEFAWARRLLHAVRARAQRLKQVAIARWRREGRSPAER